jgi:predicted permease
VATDVLAFGLFLALGLLVQRKAYPADRLRRGAWTTYFYTVTPVLVFTAFLTVPFDGEIALALAASIVSAWLVIGIGYAYSALVSTDRDERGALALAAGFPNTGFLGYPLALIAFGNPGLALMVVYDRLSWLVPASAISTTIARLHGRAGEAGRRSGPLTAIVANPPLWAAVAAVALRSTGAGVPDAVELLRDAAQVVVGPAGFFLLGLALPLERPSHDAGELRRAAGALAVRFAVAPLVLFAAGHALGAHIPGVFYLAAAMPCAFHLLILARVFDLRPHLMRLLVVGSTVPAIAAVLVATAVFR